MDLRPRTRSSRSRSSTPFVLTSLESDILEESHVEQSVSKSIRRTTTATVRSGNGSSTFDSINEEYHTTGHVVKPSTSSKRLTRSAKMYKTSDYSSEEGDNEVSSTRSISENEKNRILEDAKRSAGSSDGGITALGLYRRAKRYWDEYPKTDWTYSPFSKDRVEIAPGVVAMPNMSRRHLSSYDKYTNTEKGFFSSSSSSLSSNIRPQNLFGQKITSSSSSSSSSSNIFTRFATKILVSIIMIVVGTVYLFFRTLIFGYRSVHSVCLRLAKGLHRLTSRVMLADTWLLRKRTAGGKTASLMALCLVPLVIFAGWWFLTTMGGNLYGTLFNATHSLIPSLNFKTEVGNDNLEYVTDDDPDRYQSKRSNQDFDLSDHQLDKIASYIRSKDEEKLQEDLVDRLIGSESIQRILSELKHAEREKSHNNKDFEEKLEKQQSVIRELTEELEKMKRDVEHFRNREMDALRSDLREDYTRKIDHLVYNMNRCCRKSLDLEPLILRSLTAILNDPDFLGRQNGLKDWLKALFVAKGELESKLSNLTEVMTSQFDSLLETNGKFLMERVISELHREKLSLRNTKVVKSHDDDVSLTDDRIRAIVADTLKIYDADRTGLVDYAMEPMGGQIITTRCTESYSAGTAVVSILGIPLWYPSSTPRTVITPGINPGRCWAFQNYPGLLVIKLMSPVKLEAFSLEHVSRLLVPDGKIDSAPKDFEVYGLVDENDRNGAKIGEYRYDMEGEPLQFFIAQKADRVFEYVELRITSNHGNPNYTCLYRFRVHGKRVERGR